MPVDFRPRFRPARRRRGRLGGGVFQPEPTGRRRDPADAVRRGDGLSQDPHSERRTGQRQAHQGRQRRRRIRLRRERPRSLYRRQFRRRSGQQGTLLSSGKIRGQPTPVRVAWRSVSRALAGKALSASEHQLVRRRKLRRPIQPLAPQERRETDAERRRRDGLRASSDRGGVGIRRARRHEGLASRFPGTGVPHARRHGALRLVRRDGVRERQGPVHRTVEAQSARPSRHAGQRRRDGSGSLPAQPIEPAARSGRRVRRSRRQRVHARTADPHRLPPGGTVLQRVPRRDGGIPPGSGSRSSGR